MSICLIAFDLCFAEKRIEFVLPSSKFTFSLLSVNNQLKLKNLDLDVPLLFLYPYGKLNKYHWHIIEVHYLQPVACR